MHKVRQAMKSSENNPMDGNAYIDEFVVGGRETGKQGRSYSSKKKKAVCAVQLTEDGKVRRFYALKIKDFSTKSLQGIFDRHISRQAKITADEWRGYRPICKDYQIEQVVSQNGMNFKALHTMIHQVKSWIRTTYSWVSEKHIDRYLSEFCFRINRSQSKENNFQ